MAGKEPTELFTDVKVVVTNEKVTPTTLYI